MKRKDWIVFVARVIVGIVLIYSGASKAIAPAAEFAAALEAYKLLPTALIPTLAQVWPWLELLTGTYLLFGYYTRLSLAVGAGMFSVFLIVLVTSLLRGIDPGSCGCFGVGISLSLRQTAVLDALLLALTVAAFILVRSGPARWSADAWIEAP